MPYNQRYNRLGRIATLSPPTPCPPTRTPNPYLRRIGRTVPYRVQCTSAHGQGAAYRYSPSLEKTTHVCSRTCAPVAHLSVVSAPDLCVCARACVRVRVCACVRACVRGCVSE